MNGPPPPAGAPATLRRERPGCFQLEFRRAAGRTYIGRQYVSYPFHLTRPLLLDPALPELATVYAQSSSGGLYRNDRLEIFIELGACAAAQVTTQAATIVHDCRGEPAVQDIDISAGEDSFLAYTPDAQVLFPGAALHMRQRVRLSPGAVLLLCETFASHDPAGRKHAFAGYASDLSVLDSEGRLLVRDRFEVAGAALGQSYSPIGRWPLAASFFFLGPRTRLPPRAALADCTAGHAAVSGVTDLPNNAGLGMRCLADDAVAAVRIAQAIFRLAVEAALGRTPAPRPK